MRSLAALREVAGVADICVVDICADAERIRAARFHFMLMTATQVRGPFKKGSIVSISTDSNDNHLPNGNSTAQNPEGTPQQVRSAVRFPLALPVVIFHNGREIAATTRNISANGVLLVADRAWEPGATLHFAMKMPGGILGARQDVMVRCTGRVVRCRSNEKEFEVAATIDEYQFADK